MTPPTGRRGHAELRITDDGVHTVLVAGQGEPLSTSEPLTDNTTALDNLAAQARAFGVLDPRVIRHPDGTVALDCGASLLRVELVDQRTPAEPSAPGGGD